MNDTTRPASLFDRYEPVCHPPMEGDAWATAVGGEPDKVIWFLFSGDRLLSRPVAAEETTAESDGVERTDAPAWMDGYALGGIEVPLGRLPEALVRRLSVVHPLGRFEDVSVLAALLETDGASGAETPSAGYSLDALRTLLPAMEADAGFLAGRALQMVNWERNNRFCGRCGTRMAPRTDERAMECPACRFRQYPRLSPAIIVAVTRGDELLLAHANHFAPGLFSLVAGFVEPGETFEDCVAREVREEVGIGVKGIRYLASQPWPFPDSLMVGFTAEWAEGEVVADGVEIGEAGWYRREGMPAIPGPHTIAGRIIRTWLAGTV